MRNLSVDKLTANEKDPTASRQWGYRPELDGIRGLAILLVLIGHADRRIEGLAWVGLSLFFVLSGYLITGVLRRTPSRATFYRHRIARLAPALVVLLVALALLGQARQAAATLAYSMNWTLLSGDSVVSPLGHTWSLSVEEQFYLVWPFLLPFARARWLVVLALASMAVRWFLPVDPPWYYYATFARLDGLLLGAALALVVVPRIRGGLVAAVLLVVIGLAAPLGVQLWALAGATVASLVLVWAAPAGLSPLAGLGQISYSLYLYHWPLFLAFGPVGLVLAVPLAYVSTRLIEQPIRRWLRNDQPVLEGDVGEVQPAWREGQGRVHGEHAMTGGGI